MALKDKVFLCTGMSETDRKRQFGRMRNRLKRAIRIQNIVKEWGKNGKGYSQVWIYENIIDSAESDFDISFSTFNKDISIASPRAKLAEIEKHLMQ